MPKRPPPPPPTREELAEQIEGFNAVFVFDEEAMTQESISQQWADIEAQANVRRDLLREKVMLARQFADGQRVQAILPDGRTLTGIILGARVSLYRFQQAMDGTILGGYPNVHYGVRIESPVDYDSRKGSTTLYGIEVGQYEDFWQGDMDWPPVDSE